MKPAHGLNKKPSTANISPLKISKIQIRKSHSSPTNNGPLIILPLADPSTIVPSSSNSRKSNHNSEFPEKRSKIPISPSSNKNSSSSSSSKITYLNSSDHRYPTSSSSTATISDQQQQQRPNLKMSASSRFGKNLLPTWLGGHSTEEHEQASPTSGPTTPKSVTSPTSATTPNDNSTLDAADLNNTFETLLVNIIQNKKLTI